MAVKRIPAAAINAGEPYQDGDIVTGLMVNEVVKVLKDGVNYNKFFIDAMFSGTTEEAIVIGVPKGTLNDVAEDIMHLESYLTSAGITATNGLKAFIFRCIYGNEHDTTEITGVVALNYYKYVTDTWVHQYAVSMDTFIQGVSSDFTDYTESTNPDITDVVVVQTLGGLRQVQLKNLNKFDGVQFSDGLVDGAIITPRTIHYDAYEEMFRAINDDGTDIVIGGELQKLARNDNGGLLGEGIVVGVKGAIGQRVTFDLFDITSEASHGILPAIITNSGGIALNAVGKLSFFGEIKGLPIANFESTGTPYAEGQELYISVNSKLTNVVPAKPNLHVHMGTIERVVGSTANVFVHTLIIPHLSHSSDVLITSAANGDILIRGTDGIWRNSQRLVLAESEITKIKDGTTIVKKAEQDANGNVITTTYETKTIVSGINSRVTSLENANMIKSYTYNPTTHVLTFTYYDNTTTSFDLPLESAIVSASYDNVTQDITFVLQSGATLVVPLDDLVSGLASETWVTTYFIPKTSIVDNLTTDDATKVLSAKQGKALQDTKEALANKAIDFSTVNDTKYPTTKAVSERLLNLPITELNNHTLREVFEGGNLVVNGDFSNPSTSDFQIQLATMTITDQKLYMYATNKPVILSPLVPDYNISTNDYVYFRLTYQQSVIGSATPRLYFGSGVQLVSVFPNDTNINTVSVKSQATSNYSYTTFFNYVDNGNNVWIDNYYNINMTSLGISSLTVSQMDYWFNVYQALLVSDTNAIFSMIAQNKTALALKANTAQEAWITPTLINGATGTVQYMKDSLGFVHFRGEVTMPIGASTAFMAMPSGYKISLNSYFIVWETNSNTNTRFLIVTTGACYVGTDGNTTTADLSPITYQGA